MLTSLIDKDKDFQAILKEHIPSKEKFTTNTSFPAFSTKYPILAPYILSNQYYSIIVGTAFDYMARFIVAKVLSYESEKVLNNLVAAHALEKIFLYNKEEYSKLLAHFKKCVKKTKNYLSSEEDYCTIIPCACYFAKPDSVSRSGMAPAKGYLSLLETVDNEIILDIKNLCNIFYNIFIKEKLITPNSTVIFNPKFGYSSLCCCGADADIFVDGTLYDFKSSKFLGYKWKEVAQLYGYFLLDCLHKISKENAEQTIGDEKINKIAFYRARFGIIESLEISKIFTNDLIETLIKLKENLYPKLENVQQSLNTDNRRKSDIEFINKAVKIIEKTTDSAIIEWVNKDCKI